MSAARRRPALTEHAHDRLDAVEAAQFVIAHVDAEVGQQALRQFDQREGVQVSSLSVSCGETRIGGELACLREQRE
ncbi:hypothetical protein [Streptomyces sp. KL116D]|uniref:hypothetical protein n=1 Tax=Streptomyces sp. KL116D TaxID=3045152 RepID=UPI003556971E